MNLEIFEMSVVGVAVPGLDTVGTGYASDIGCCQSAVLCPIRTPRFSFAIYVW
jgi:hypothetical protein